MTIDPNQIASWVSQLKKHSTTWTNQLSPEPVSNYGDLAAQIRSAFIRQSLLTGNVVFEHTQCYPSNENLENIPSGYPAVYISNKQALLCNEACAVVISFEYETIVAIGSKSDIDIWKKHILDVNEQVATSY